VAKQLTDEQLESVAGLSSRKAAAILGVGKSTINSARERLRLTNTSNTEGEIVAAGTIVPTNESEVKDFLAERGIGDLTHDINYRLSAWDTPNGVQHSFRATALARPDAAPGIDWSGVAESISNFTFVPAPKDTLTDALVLQPTDYQIGKTDIGGGTLASTERALSSFARFAEIVKDRKPRHVLLANTGDIIENFCNTSSQLSTNDMDLPSQVAHAFALELEGIKMVAPLTPHLVYATVPSNHGQWRNGPKQTLGDTHADWGIAIAKQVQTALNFNPSFGSVSVQIPPLHIESMTVELGTSKIGLVHGHQRSKPENLGEWWAHQDHGRMPTWEADILLAGHFHSFRAFQSGDGRWVFVGPSSDPGSSWYANLTGQRAVAGMLSFAVDNGSWSDLAIV
jgi:hypothetical protein